jgi:hypothetical protein
MPRKRPAVVSPLPLEVGVKPHLVRVVERADKGGMVYLQWWKPGKKNHGWQSLRFRLAGRSSEDVARRVVEAQGQAQRKYEELSGQRSAERAQATRIITIADAWAILTDPSTGKYAKDTRYREQLRAALALAARVLGEEFPFVSLDKAAFRKVVRRQADLSMRRGAVGFRPAQIAGTRLLTIVTYLQDEGYLPENYIVPGGKAWHADLLAYVEQTLNRQLPEPNRPRYTEAEIDRLHAAAPAVDPRFALMLTLGELLRAEQVGRTWRSQLVDGKDGQPARLRIEGRGKKRGQILLLTVFDVAALARAFDPEDAIGYLADQEAAWRAHGRDYVLFPSALKGPIGRLRAIPGHTATVNRDQPRKWLRAAEEIAEIPRVKGLGWYGLRRRGTDAAAEAGLGGAALQNVGGWSSSRMPTEIYEDRQRAGALEEARDFRLQRGEARAARLAAEISTPSESSTEPEVSLEEEG